MYHEKIGDCGEVSYTMLKGRKMEKFRLLVYLGSRNSSTCFLATSNRRFWASCCGSRDSILNVCRLCDWLVQLRCFEMLACRAPPRLADSDDVSWPDGHAVVPENRFDALRMANGVGEG